MTDAIDLLDLLGRLRGGLSGLFPEKLWVKAEIASLQARGNGHCYLELSQSDDSGVAARARAVIWRNSWLQIAPYFREVTGSPLDAGMSILARVQVSFSELYGLSLVIDEIEPSFTLGEAELLRRRTVARLEEEGLISLQKGLGLAPLPYRLAVISAADAAGFGDFCRHLEENEYGFVFEISLFEALMQGENAPASICGALALTEGYDAVLILRGGGSALDLACFDDYGLCRAIALHGVPVFTAIGHDRDRHAADMVAYGSVKTPTALADLFIDAFASEDERIASFSMRLRMAFLSRLAEMSSALDRLSERIHAADPGTLLSRGYSLVTDSRGVIVKKASGIHPGDVLSIRFADGEVKVTANGQ